MTQQYLAGELSVLLGELQAATPDPAFAHRVAELRREAETGPPARLSVVAARALLLTDEVCWHSLTRENAHRFPRQAAISAELHHFGVCAGLLPWED
jgi:hypothetical protein